MDKIRYWLYWNIKAIPYRIMCVINFRYAKFCLRNIRIFCKYCDEMVKVDIYAKHKYYQVWCKNDYDAVIDETEIANHKYSILGNFNVLFGRAK